MTDAKHQSLPPVSLIAKNGTTEPEMTYAIASINANAERR
jgi:hypothetical protein